MNGEGRSDLRAVESAGGAVVGWGVGEVVAERRGVQPNLVLALAALLRELPAERLDYRGVAPRRIGERAPVGRPR